jgi:hypothetical protein
LVASHPRGPQAVADGREVKTLKLFQNFNLRQYLKPECFSESDATGLVTMTNKKDDNGLARLGASVIASRAIASLLVKIVEALEKHDKLVELQQLVNSKHRMRHGVDLPQ